MKQKTRWLALCLLVLFLSGCAAQTVPEPTEPAPVTLRVITTYGGDDGNRRNYEAAVTEYERSTGNRILDYSDTANEEWKARVMTDFETGSEPDVLFFFTNADADPLIRARKVVSLKEIREVYPDYAANMTPDLLPRARDGECYAVPMTGYWEFLYVNKAVLSRCGVELPGADYSWEQFLTDCSRIRDAGLTPIACSLAEVAHYWFEFAVMNNGTASNHADIPVIDQDGRLLENTTARKWIEGLEDIRTLYESGFFPDSTLTSGDAQTVALFGSGQAAFLLDGSWKMGFLEENYPEEVEHFAVCPVPAKGKRSSHETIGGISSGFFITRRAWENPEKRQAAVEFVSHMTSDAVISTFVTTEITALQEPVPPIALDSLQQSAANIMASTVKWVGAVQDLISREARSSLFSDIQYVVSGKITAFDAVEDAMQRN